MSSSEDNTICISSNTSIASHGESSFKTIPVTKFWYGAGADGLEDNEKIKKLRERNREHAKKTRQKKKAILEGLKLRLVQLQEEVS